MHRSLSLSLAIAIPAVALLSACGGGGADPEPTAAVPLGLETSVAATEQAPASPSPAPVAPDARIQQAPTAANAGSPTEAQRSAAATATANSATNACAPIRPFYWEVGHATGRAVSGSVNSPASSLRYAATTPLSIASGTKWIYGMYVAEKRGGALTDVDRKFLAMRAGYVSFSTCQPGQTVDSCLASGINGAYSPEMDNRFFYDGGHMQRHASATMGLGRMDSPALAAEVRSQLGSDIPLTFSQPQLAGGIAMTPDAYGRLLRKVLAGQLRMSSLLGSGAVCTNPGTCGLQNAVYAPIQGRESWQYSLGHWVESDPVHGDGAFSSPGAFGFYPWIDAGRTSYGIVARFQPQGSWPSVQCGRLIRKSWLTGVAS